MRKSPQPMFSSHPRNVRAASPERFCRSSAPSPRDDRSRHLVASAIALIALLTPPALQGRRLSPAESIASDTSTVERLLAAMTLEEKIALTHRGLTGQALKRFWAGGKPYGYRLVQLKDETRRD